MKEKRLLLIVNPISGKAKMVSNLMAVVRILSQNGFAVTVYPTKAPSDATDRINTVKSGEFERIVVCGGDGTLNEVITGVMRNSLDVKIGYVPAGTLNEWSASLKIPRSIPEAAKAAAGDGETLLDLGKFNDRYFSYTASFGAFTQASYSTPQGIKNIFGQTAYFFEGLKLLGDIRPFRLKFESDEKTVEDDFIFGAVSNSLSVGGIVKFKENTVDLCDGMFEVLLIKKVDNLLQFQNLLDGVLKGDFTRKQMIFFRTKKLKVTGGKDMPWTLDGEYAPGGEDITIENIPSALHLITEQKKKESE
ncbi:MAG: diacylglycerol kinase family lipid kinase [Clostridia bacterium]|nr:diacylglycerol kinase family lipid kinase [Clostridia bacterium]